MAATTTDREPVEIFRVGVDTTARALVQHAYLADQTPYREPGEFARGLRDSGIFTVVASTWHWGLQFAHRHDQSGRRFSVGGLCPRPSRRQAGVVDWSWSRCKRVL
jgi:hypothetical protein